MQNKKVQYKMGNNEFKKVCVKIVHVIISMPKLN